MQWKLELEPPLPAAVTLSNFVQNHSSGQNHTCDQSANGRVIDNVHSVVRAASVSLSSIPAPMPATCDGGDNDACDKHNGDDGRDIFHDAPCAGNIGLIVRTPRETKYSRYYAADQT